MLREAGFAEGSPQYELYRDSVAGHRVAGIETDETDRNLREWGAEQALEEIPPGYPPSHVWWHRSLSGK
jgi:hypothetical protein